MRKRLSAKTRELIALVVLCLAGGRIASAMYLQFGMDSAYRSRLYFRWFDYLPMIAGVAFAVLFTFALVRIVILLRRRAMPGSCPRCSMAIDIHATICEHCGEEFRRTSRRGGQRLIHQTRTRNAIVFAAWFSMIAWALSFDLGLCWESAYFRGGSGCGIELRNGAVAYVDRTPNAPGSARALYDPIAKDAIAAADALGIDVDFHVHDSLEQHVWWPQIRHNQCYGYSYLAGDPLPPIAREFHDKYKLSTTGYGYNFSERHSYFPLCLPTAFFGVIALIIRVGERDFPAGCCQTCGYDLHSVVSANCPECNRPIAESSYGIPLRLRRPTRPSPSA
ncbi:MAG: hypothetical protein H6819_04325 [Phycisphaerales bacterium]|nr:hypothetical protein [Phycisphaerales bacterium]MCB9856425.1 hypothetical protein [Phycisphaerales bacterium]MCB9864556.1 hypothetical protein [Phycisphaerales bacterium]